MFCCDTSHHGLTTKSTTQRLPTKRCSSLPWSSYFPCPGDGLGCSPKHRFLGIADQAKGFWDSAFRILVGEYQTRIPNQPPNYQWNWQNRSDIGTFQLQMLKDLRRKMLLRTNGKTMPSNMINRQVEPATKKPAKHPAKSELVLSQDITCQSSKNRSPSFFTILRNKHVEHKTHSTFTKTPPNA